jgi:hypothetical protein
LNIGHLTIIEWLRLHNPGLIAFKILRAIHIGDLRLAGADPDNMKISGQFEDDGAELLD